MNDANKPKDAAQALEQELPQGLRNFFTLLILFHLFALFVAVVAFGLGENGLFVGDFGRLGLDVEIKGDLHLR